MILQLKLSMLTQLLRFKNEIAHVPGGQLFRALEQVIGSQTIEQAVQLTCSSERRQRILPTNVVVDKSDCNKFLVIRLNSRCI